MQDKTIEKIIRLNGLMLLNLYGIKKSDIKKHPESLNTFIEILKEEVIDECLKCLPEKRTGVDFEPIKGDWNDGFNSCLDQIKENIKKKK